ncbi:SpoIIE family protein phosphatase [Candidatus Parabeggiatoa sp. HSG14]|uniref:SpoIIE family protein phosphatase n=1 Tax=Candidatus Parabeggiatoa sp. HSG14 TaxID=3055593 RepID=UPI0025A7ADB6|nr:SpoIIE family protein phosphatase [Thiotrichales bacterium HSG14]
MLIKFFNRLIDDISNKLPLRFVLISLFILQIIAVAGLVGWLSLQNGQQAVNDVAKQLRGEITARIEQHLSSFFKTPPLINFQNLNAIQLGQLELQDFEGLEKHFFKQIQVLGFPGYLYFADTLGKETAAQRKPDGSFTIWDGFRQSGKHKGYTLIEYTADKQGNRIKEFNTYEDYDPREEPWYKSAVKFGKPAWTAIYKWPWPSAYMGLDATLPIYDDAGKLQGVTGIAMILSDINEFLSNLKIGQRGQTFIIERSGEIVATSTSEPPFSIDGDGKEQRLKATESNISSTRATAQYLQKHFGDFKNIQTSAQLDFEIDGERQFIQVAPFQDEFGLDWLVVVTVPENDFMAQINANTRYTIILSIIALIVAILIALLTANWIIRPILQINHAAKKLTEGQWQQTLPVKRSDELGQLARSFNLMAKQLKTSIDTLENKNQELQELDKVKDEFLANTSHELRTPLNGIIGLAESLIDGAAGKLDDKVKANLAMIMGSGKRLFALVNDILDFSKLKHQDIELQLKPMSLREIAEIVLTLSQSLKGQKDLQLVNAIDINLPPALADENRVQQIFYNLVGNAIKFTESGQVKISAKVENLEGEGNLSYLEITISDTGIGIPEDKLDRIFESFEQAEGSTAREYGGTGLGLTVTKQLVQLHSGKIWVESTQGEGSQFKFTLPISEEGETSQPSQDSITNKSLLKNVFSPAISTSQATGEGQIKILAVDDEPVNLQVLVNHLSLHDYIVIKALSGIEALTLLEEGLKPDIILLDVMMPKMTGYEVMRKIRETYEINELPALLLTAKNQVSDLVTGLDSGANDYLTKPVSKDELLARIKTHLNIKRLKAENLRMSAELEVSRRLQQMLLPPSMELSQIEGLEIAGFMEPADEVGGDYYDVQQRGDRVLCGIGDVIGHGLESGVLAMMTQTAVKTLLANNETDSVKFLTALNETIYHNVQRMNSDKNLTFALLDYQNGQVRLTGQHEEMIVVQQGELKLIDTVDLGFPIGLEENITGFIAEAKVSLKSGDIIVLYTDGITEAENLDKEQYGLERLCETVKQNWQHTADEIRKAVIDDVKQYIGTQKVFDDITLLVLRQK